METFRRLSLIFCLITFLVGCSTVDQRSAFFDNLSPERVSEKAWKSYTGTYKGTIHSTAQSYSTVGITVADVRIELSGTPDAPLVYLEMDSAGTSAWNASVTYLEKFTNITQRQYGVRGRLLAYSHAPNQLLISLQPAILSPNRGAAMILTFRGKGFVDVEYIGHYSRRGTGALSRVPTFGFYSE